MTGRASVASNRSPGGRRGTDGPGRHLGHLGRLGEGPEVRRVAGVAAQVAGDRGHGRRVPPRRDRRADSSAYRRRGGSQERRRGGGPSRVRGRGRGRGLDYVAPHLTHTLRHEGRIEAQGLGVAADGHEGGALVGEAGEVAVLQCLELCPPDTGAVLDGVQGEIELFAGPAELGTVGE